jgi:nicotinamide-nucleotide amidase
MKAEIITIGDEILIGQIIDTNSAWIGEQLEQEGIQVRQITSISDDREHIKQAVTAALEHSDLVLLTGGLGPTNDDITKHTLCQYFASELMLDRQVLTDIEERFATIGKAVNKLNRDQALVPRDCQVIRNHRGTAPGMWFRKEGKHVFSMPGVPHEMKAMVAAFLPLLKEEVSTPEVIHQTVVVRGLVESLLAEKLSSWEANLPTYVKLAYLPSKGYVRLRFTARGTVKEEMLNGVSQHIGHLQNLLGSHFCSHQLLLQEEIVAKLLKEKCLTIATAESCTGGAVAKKLTAVPGSSSFFKGSIVAYTEELKAQLLAVDPALIDQHGVVSEEVVAQMAKGVQALMKTDYALATSGFVGPDGGTTKAPLGTVCIALATPSGVLTETHHFQSDRKKNIQRVVEKALEILQIDVENK